LFQDWQGLAAVWDIFDTQIVRRLRAWNNGQVLNVTIKICVIIYFLSKNDNSIIASNGFITPLQSFCILIRAVSYGSS
jgi:hypothetical protein